MALKRKFIRILDEDRSTDWRRLGSDVIETYECPNADIATHLATLRAATFSGYGLTALPCREIEGREHTAATGAHRRNVATIIVKYSNKITGSGPVLRQPENIGRAVVHIVPIMSTRNVLADGHLLWERFELTENDDKIPGRWIPVDEDDERFWIESRIALVTLECALELDSGLVATAMALIGKVNNAVLPNLGAAAKHSLLMLAPTIRIEAGDTLAMARFNLLYFADLWTGSKLKQQKLVNTLLLGEAGVVPPITFPVWKDTDAAQVDAPFAEGNFATIYALAYWYAL